MPKQEAIDILTSFELHELVYQTLSMLNVPVGSLDWDDSAVAVSYAIRKVEAYAKAVQEAEDRRYELGVEIADEVSRAEARREDDTDEGDRLKQDALRRMGDYEIQQHNFTVYVGQIRRLLSLAHRLVGVDMEPNDAVYLDTYQPLRNQFEHLDERLPGEEKGGRLVLDIPGRMLLGLNDDGAGNITVRRDTENIVAAVNQRGVDEITAIVGRSFETIRDKCLEHLDRFFDDHPELTADVSWIHPTFAQRLKDDTGDFV